MEIGSGLCGDLPKVLYVRDIAQLLGRTEKAVRNAIARGSLPPLRNIGGRACWLREDVPRLGSERRGHGKPKVSVEIAAGRYSYDPSKMMVTFTLKIAGRKKPERVRKVTPGPMDEVAALAWGKAIEGEVQAEIFDKLRREDTAQHNPDPAPTPAPTPAPVSYKPTPAPTTCDTVAVFWERFESEYVNAQKPATRRGYRSTWSNYFREHLGSIPLDMIDRRVIAKFRGHLGKLKPSSRNQILYKLRAMLDQAVTWGILEESPQIKPDKEPKRPDPIPYSEDEAETLIAASRTQSPEHTALVLLLLHASLRVGEVCALRWSDVDFRKGLATIQHNFSDGEETTPKGGVAAPVGLSPELCKALRTLPRVGEYVLMREVDGRLEPHTPHSIRARLNATQRLAGLRQTGPHYLRHAGITILAERGTDPLDLQAHARHARFSTTQRYIHKAKERAAQQAAAMWTHHGKRPARPVKRQAPPPAVHAPARPVDKKLAKPAQTPRKPLKIAA